MSITNETASTTTTVGTAQPPLSEAEQEMALRYLRSQAETFIAGLRRYPDLLQKLIELLGSRPELSLLFFGIGPISSNGPSQQQTERLTLIFSQPQVIDTLVLVMGQNVQFKQFINIQVSHALNAARVQELREQLNEHARFIDRLNGVIIKFETTTVQLWSPSSALRRATSWLVGSAAGLVAGAIHWSYTGWWLLSLLIVLCGIVGGFLVGRSGTIKTREVVVGGSIVYPELQPATPPNKTEVTA